MNFTRTKFARMIKAVLLVLALVMIASYAASRSLPYFRGPSIAIFQPMNGAAVSSTTITVIGRAQRINSLSMNDKQIQIDEQGNFKQTLIIFPGVNIISFDATDQFKRTTHSELRIFGTQAF